jgi:phosphoglycolate phosphatase-like HAD superfamily hydrolase
MSSAAPTTCVLFDVDGTLCETFQLGLSATRTVLREYYTRTGAKAADVPDEELVSEASYHEGTRYTTPRRFAW